MGRRMRGLVSPSRPWGTRGSSWHSRLQASGPRPRAAQSGPCGSAPSRGRLASASLRPPLCLGFARIFCFSDTPMRCDTAGRYTQFPAWSPSHGKPPGKLPTRTRVCVQGRRGTPQGDSGDAGDRGGRGCSEGTAGTRRWGGGRRPLLRTRVPSPGCARVTWGRGVQSGSGPGVLPSGILGWAEPERREGLSLIPLVAQTGQKKGAPQILDTEGLPSFLLTLGPGDTPTETSVVPF